MHVKWKNSIPENDKHPVQDDEAMSAEGERALQLELTFYPLRRVLARNCSL